MVTQRDTSPACQEPTSDLVEHYNTEEAQSAGLGLQRSKEIHFKNLHERENKEKEFREDSGNEEIERLRGEDSNFSSFSQVSFHRS